jgi:hypothetical protein
MNLRNIVHNSLYKRCPSDWHSCPYFMSEVSLNYGRGVTFTWLYSIQLYFCATLHFIQLSIPHIRDKMYYSVPYEYIKHLVDVRVTRTIIEVFFKNFRIASHMRLHGKEGQLSTLPEHMPVHHKQHVDFNWDYFLKWAEAVGLLSSK